MAGIVTVACKHPSGLHLDLEAADGTKARVTLKGNAVPFGVPSYLIGGYAMTEVDADHWAAWLEKYKDSSLVKDRIIFAQPKRSNAEAQAKDQAEVPAIAEPVDPTTVRGVTEAGAE